MRISDWGSDVCSSDLDEAHVEALLAATLANFKGRHRNLLDIFDRRATEMSGAFACDPSLSEARHQLIGAYFLNEYSFEAAALFNPSIVRHPDHFGTTGGRFLLNARAVGEALGRGDVEGRGE